MGKIMFKHFLTTRINLEYRATADKPYSPHVIEETKRLALDPEWLERRLFLLNTYCLPSVRGQDTDNFTWLLLMHEDTPEEYRDKFKSLEDKVGNITTEVVFGRGTDLDVVPAALLSRLDGTEKFTINTSLDSDDCISNNFISTIQKNFRNKEEFIDVPRGYVVKEEMAYTRRTSSVSPFRSFVEPVSNIKSVYCTIHGASSEVAPVIFLEPCEASWLQVLHEENLTNRLKRKSQDKGMPFETIKKRFSL
jgi:hypothetical protein